MFLSHVLDYLVVHHLLLGELDLADMIDVSGFLVESAYFFFELINAEVILLLKVLHLLVFELKESLSVTVVTMLLLACTELIAGHLLHFEGLLLREGILYEVNFVGLDHVLLVLLLIEHVNLLDELLDLDFVLLELPV